MVDRPLRPTKDRRLGKLLNYQQPNLEQIYLSANYYKNNSLIYSEFLLKTSCYAELKGKILSLLTRSPRKKIR